MVAGYVLVSLHPSLLRFIISLIGPPHAFLHLVSNLDLWHGVHGKLSVSNNLSQSQFDKQLSHVPPAARYLPALLHRSLSLLGLPSGVMIPWGGNGCCCWEGGLASGGKGWG